MKNEIYIHPRISSKDDDLNLNMKYIMLNCEHFGPSKLMVIFHNKESDIQHAGY